MGMSPRNDMFFCFVVRREEGGVRHEFLQLRRRASDFMGGTWQTVCGRIEGDEKAWQAALRELREETGLVPLEFYQFDVINTFYLAADDSTWMCPAFCAIVDRAAAITLNEEHDAVRWIGRAQLDREFMWPGERAQLAELCREILDDGPAKPYMRIEI